MGNAFTWASPCRTHPYIHQRKGANAYPYLLINLKGTIGECCYRAQTNCVMVQDHAFLFDYTAKDQALYDFRGDEFPSSVAAIDFATEIALNLKHSLTSDWIGWTVEVRSAEGKEIYSLPVDAAELLAA
jgi:hypothetical protein